jgi:septal ring factor EnvC (AmiA/AmiB activator)
MNEEHIFRELATANKLLAESLQGLGGLVRESGAQQAETNRLLGEISETLSEMRDAQAKQEERQADSERAIRTVQADVRMLRSTQVVHGQDIEKLRQQQAAKAAASGE